MLEVKIVRVDVSAAKAQETIDHVAEEKPFYIFLNRTHYATIFCSPSNLKELAVGHALSEGTLKSRAIFGFAVYHNHQHRKRSRGLCTCRDE
jgi:FdhD protein